MYRQFLMTLLIVLGFATTGHAQGRPGQDSGPQKDWDISVGALVLISPEYRGADDYRVLPLPNIAVSYKDDQYFLDVRRGLGLHLLKEETERGRAGYALRASVRYDFSDRSNDDNPAFANLDDLDGAVELVVDGELPLFPGIKAGIEAVQGLNSSGHGGFYVTPRLQYSHAFSRTVILTITPSVTYASGDYMDAFYGVSAAESLVSPFAEYEIDGGFENAAVSAGLLYRFSGNWAWFSQASYERLLGDAADSPLVDTADQFTFISAISYRF